MSATTERESPPPLAGGDGLKGERLAVALPVSTTIPARIQASVAGGMYSRRAEWIFAAFADLELSGVSCLLRAPAGAEAKEILRRLPQPLTIAPLEDLVNEIRLHYAKGGFRDWHTTVAAFADNWHEQIRCYSRGPKCRFTEHEAEVHKALVNLLVREGGDPWKR